MRKGFFTEIQEGVEIKGEGLYEFLEYTPVGDKCVDLYKYVYELDDEYALYLSEEFGYDIHVLVKYDEDTKSDVLVRVFNSFEVGNQVLFVDARGITSNLKEIISVIADSSVEECRVFKFTDVDEARAFLTSLTQVQYERVHKEIPFIIKHLRDIYC